MNINDVIRKHYRSAHLSPRYVGIAPTYEWTGLKTDELVADLNEIGFAFESFRANVREHPDFGKMCMAFTTFCIKPEDVTPSFDPEEAEHSGFKKGMEKAMAQLRKAGIDPRTRKPINNERKADQPDLEVMNDSVKHQVFMLKTGEWLDMKTSSQPGHHRANGPALVYREISGSGMRTEEHDVNNPDTWRWIGMLVRFGAPHFSLRLTSHYQGEPEPEPEVQPTSCQIMAEAAQIRRTEKAVDAVLKPPKRRKS